MAKKLDWDRVNSEKRVEAYGKQPASVGMRDEMPPSHSDFLIEFDPLGNRVSYIEYLKRVVEAEVSGSAVPSVPRKIRQSVQPLVNHYGGIMAWARRTRDYGHLYSSYVGKIRAAENARKDKIRRQFLRQIALADVLEQDGIENLQPPEEIVQEVQMANSISAWAKSRSEYRGIRINALNCTRPCLQSY